MYLKNQPRNCDECGEPVTDWDKTSSYYCKEHRGHRHKFTSYLFGQSLYKEREYEKTDTEIST